MKGIIFKQIVHLISSSVQWLGISCWKDARFHHADKAMPRQTQNNRHPVGWINQLINAQGHEGQRRDGDGQDGRILLEIHNKLAHEQLAEEARAGEWRVDNFRKKLNWLRQKVYNELNLFKYSHFKNGTVTLRMECLDDNWRQALGGKNIFMFW